MTEKLLSRVLRFQCLISTGDFFDDCPVGGCPGEGDGVGVVLFEVVVYGHLEIDDGAEDAATDAFSGDLGEESLDQVEPGRRGWREMHVEAGMTGEPFLDRITTGVKPVMCRLTGWNSHRGSARSGAVAGVYCRVSVAGTGLVSCSGHRPQSPAPRRAAKNSRSTACRASVLCKARRLLPLLTDRTPDMD